MVICHSRNPERILESEILLKERFPERFREMTEKQQLHVFVIPASEARLESFSKKRFRTSRNDGKTTTVRLYTQYSI